MSQGKSGIKTLKPGEVLFDDGELASSLYIIQKGQLRLYKPKGKGFIEIAVLRTGEVIGEMAYFDDKGGGKRSCSASAMVTSDVIEISFTAFAKTMAGLNPWFKTIIHTLAKRLRETNSRVKELENNSASIDYRKGKETGYDFFKPHDIIKILGTFFLMYKAHGEKHELGLAIHRKTIDLYIRDIYTIMEAKLDEMIFVLEKLGLMEVINDKDGFPKIHILKSVDRIRSIFVFYNTERFLSEETKLSISDECQTFLEAIFKESQKNENKNDPKILVPISKMLEEWKIRKERVTIDSLEGAIDQELVGEVIVDDTQGMTLEVFYPKLKKKLPHIQFKNLIRKVNRTKRT
jgi:CRP/FNR family cyclic AMP-dependent transcriptional regulator